MDDYLTEQDQWELVKRWLKENGPWIIGGILVAAVGIFGWRWYQERVTAEAQAAATDYAALSSAIETRHSAKATDIATRLRKTHPDTPYVDQADLSLARLHVERNELDPAAERLRAVLDHSKDSELKEIARLRLARVLLAQNKPDEAWKLIQTPPDGPFSPRYSEVRGDVLVAKNDSAGALKAYREALLAAEPGIVDQNELQLKMNDLTSAPVEAKPAAATSGPTPAEPAATSKAGEKK